MPLILTPSQLSRRAELYHQLSQLTSAGLGLIQAIDQLRKHPPSYSFRLPLARLLAELNKGLTLTESLRQVADWMPVFDIALIEAGERSGRLDVCFRSLADYYTERAAMARTVVGALVYPVFLFHFAVFIFPFAQFFTSGDWVTYLSRTFGILLPIYAIVALLIFAGQSTRGEIWRSLVEKLLHPIPLLGSGRRALALSRLAMALEALISAGVNVIQAWELSATVSASPTLRRTVTAWHPKLAAGQTPAELVSASFAFPELFANQYASGEISGKLDDVLRRLHKYYQDEGVRKLQSVAQWTPRIIYMVIVFLIAWKIIQFWTGYFEQVRTIGEF